jgi:dephospho-CoA kinase
MHDSPSQPLAVGLTGGIASGKTSVSDLFAELGVPVIDTDSIARQLVDPGQPALGEIVDLFGTDALLPDGRLDRAALRKAVFGDPALRARLNQILHPRIRAEMIRRIREVTHPYCLVVVPLLVESALNEAMDRVLVVDVPEATQFERLTLRDGISAELARKMIAAQAERRERLDVADDVIDNTGSLDDLRRRVAQLDQVYRSIRDAV